MVCLYLKDVSLIFGPCPEQVRAVVDSGQSHASSIIVLLVSDECWGVHVPPQVSYWDTAPSLGISISSQKLPVWPWLFHTVIARRVWLTPRLCFPETRTMAAGRL